MAKSNKLAPVINKPAEIIDAAIGKVQYKFEGSDTLLHGDFLAEFHVVFPNEDRKTFPTSTYLKVQIAPNLDISLPGSIEENIIIQVSEIEQFKTEITAEVEKVNNFQSQIDQMTIEGDSSVEAAQARVKADGSSFTTLRDRLNNADEHLAQTATDLDQRGLNVKLFGAVGDGFSHPLSNYYSTLTEARIIYPKATALTDEIDTCAIQKAIDSGRKVYIPEGTYLISNTINISREGVYISGAGLKSTRLTYKGTQLDFSIFYLSSSSFATIEKLNTHNPANKGIGIRVKSGTGNLVTRDFGAYFLDVGIYYEENTFLHYIENCHFYGCSFGVKSVWNFNAITFIRTSFGSCDVGLEVGEGRTVSIESCHFEENRIGLKKINGGNISVSKSYFEANSDNSIQIVWGTESPEIVTIDSCDFYRTTSTGAEISYHLAENRFVNIQNCLFKAGVPAYAVTQYQYTLAKFTWLNNTLVNSEIMQDKPSLERLLKNTDQRSIYSNHNGIYKLITEDNINLKNYIAKGETCLRFVLSSTSKVITLPRISSLVDAPAVSFFFQGATDTVTVSFANEDANTWMNGVRTLTTADNNKEFKIVCLRATAAQTEYRLLS